MWHVFLSRLSYNEIRRSDPRPVFSVDTLHSDRPLLVVDVLLMVGSMWHFDPVQQISPSRGPLVWRCSSGDPCTPGQCSTGNTLEDSVELFIIEELQWELHRKLIWVSVVVWFIPTQNECGPIYYDIRLMWSNLSIIDENTVSLFWPHVERTVWRDPTEDTLCVSVPCVRWVVRPHRSSHCHIHHECERRDPIVFSTWQHHIILYLDVKVFIDKDQVGPRTLYW
jgi:hypothetical protein